jgi:hypothetical protein
MSEPPSEEGLEDIVRKLRQKVTLAATLREDILIHKLNKMVKSSKDLQADKDAILAEINTMKFSKKTGHVFELDGVLGIENANIAQTEWIADRVRLVEIARGCHAQLGRLREIYQTAMVYLRENEDVSKMTKTAQDDICHVALDSVGDRINSLKTILEIVKEAISLVDKRVDNVEQWFYLHQQHARLTYFKKGHHNDERLNNAGFKPRRPQAFTDDDE